LRFTKLNLNGYYSKRGYKAPKERAVDDSVEDANLMKKTAQLLVFFNIRRNCSKTEAFVAKIKITSLVVGAVAL
jgi:hypothetical protein